MRTWQHINSDCGNTITGNTFDEYQINEDNKPIVIVRVEYDESDTRITTKQLDETKNINLITTVQLLCCCIAREFEKCENDYEFYCDAFRDKIFELRY